MSTEASPRKRCARSQKRGEERRRKKKRREHSAEQDNTKLTLRRGLEKTNKHKVAENVRSVHDWRGQTPRAINFPVSPLSSSRKLLLTVPLFVVTTWVSKKGAWTRRVCDFGHEVRDVYNPDLVLTDSRPDPHHFGKPEMPSQRKGYACRNLAYMS